MNGQSPGYPWDNPELRRVDEELHKWDKYEKDSKKQESEGCGLINQCVHLAHLNALFNKREKDYEIKYNLLHEKYLNVLSENIQLKKKLDPNYQPVKKIGNDRN